MTFNTKTDADLTAYVKAINEIKESLPERLSGLGVDDITIKKFTKFISFILQCAGDSEAFEHVKTQSGHSMIEFTNEWNDTTNPSFIIAIRVTEGFNIYDYTYTMKHDTLIKRKVK